jgi:hypothetical protein
VNAAEAAHAKANWRSVDSQKVEFENLKLPVRKKVSIDENRENVLHDAAEWTTRPGSRLRLHLTIGCGT